MLRLLKALWRKVLSELRKLLRKKHHHPKRPVKLDQLIEGECGMDITKNVGEVVHSIPIERNKNGDIIPGLPVPANVQYSVDNPAVGQLTQNDDGTADVLGLSPGTVNLSWVDTNEPDLPASVKTLQFNAVIDNTPASLDQQLS